ncbi:MULTISPECIES: winged helix-turn-helix transcriptional regulator [Streptomyces]|uniref:Redox-sensing transcriptional regulator QorR n=1 Tax=Streptomyces venezuelae (strain ATCC 10712 / CBS 650.69 / DSM 40230 / JCM 4526 / NBRC 13096 / PD 04745) TaxID=953739 RepID=F2RIM8_STRVP|nr:helix-turn-helix domain-containing protein [Streptomyces venezuelae]APE23280.1 transcriptional regulator [Streptomyces venezuelae]QES00658.1 transcriptional regulator [Streptomyces venezuelae ATCC 10712]CCA57584.1 Redox-sensing transcriptional regulator QorR [Streptomyces venezuelae ATCC 10712]
MGVSKRTPEPLAPEPFARVPDVNQQMCPSRLVLEHVTSRWGVLVLAALLERSYRFSELRRRVGGVSEKMLAQTLQTLERDGFVDRDAKPIIPPRVDYSLTPLGAEAARRVWELARWSERQVAAVEEARERYDGARRERATNPSQ